MKKKYYIYLINILLVSCIKKEVKNDLINTNIKGSVESIILIKKEFKSNFEEKIISEYNLKGNLTSKKIYFNNNLYRSKILKYEDYFLSSAIELVYNKKRVESKTVSEYNKNGDVIVIKKYNSKNKLTDEWENEYEYNSNSKIKFINRLKTFGLIKDKRTKDTNYSSFIGNESYIYDDNKNLILIKKKDDFGNTELIKFNEKGNVLEELSFTNQNILESKYNYKYDENNNLIFEKGVLSDNSKYYYTYEIKKNDKEGNWVEQLISYENSPLKILTRKIKYYN